MPSLVIRSAVERAERLLRRPVVTIEAFWALIKYSDAIQSLAPAETIQLPTGARVIVSCAADQNLKLCWMQSSTQVEIEVDQIAVVPSALTGAFIRNDSADLTSVVRVVTF